MIQDAHLQTLPYSPARLGIGLKGCGSSEIAGVPLLGSS